MWCPKSIQMVAMHSSLDILHNAACAGCPCLLSHHSSAVCWHVIWFTAVCISNRRNARMPAFILALSIHGSPLCSWLMLMDACHGLSLKGIGMAKLLSPRASDDASALHQPSVTVAVLPAVPCMTNMVASSRTLLLQTLASQAASSFVVLVSSSESWTPLVNRHIVVQASCWTQSMPQSTL